VDEIGPLFLLALVGIFILVAPIVALVRARAAVKRATDLQTELQSSQKLLYELTARIYTLEQAQKSQPGVVDAATKSAPPPQPSPPKPVPDFVAPVAPISGSPPPVRPVEPAPNIQTPPTSPLPPPPVTRTPSPPLRVPDFAAADSAPQPKRNWADMEERLGANWLNKIGTAAFVIGVALLLNYSMHYLGAEGKIILGYAISAILLVVGIIGERNERYRIAGRAVLGGGWALAYFTTYALHNIAAVRLVESASVGFALLFIVAAAMVVHSLRYHSEITTGFAYLLAFVTIAVSEIPMGALVASALLAASLAYVLRARKWFAIEPLAIIATYAVHWIWLNQIYEHTGGYKIFPQFKQSVALLTAYWAIYLVSYFLREANKDPERQLLSRALIVSEPRTAVATFSATVNSSFGAGQSPDSYFVAKISLAGMRYFSGDQSDADQQLRSTLSAQASSSVALRTQLLRELAWWMYRAGKLEDAAKALEDARQALPQQSETMLQLAWVYTDMARQADAQQSVSAASRLSVFGAENEAVLAVISARTNEHSTANNQFQSASEQDQAWMVTRWVQNNFSNSTAAIIKQLETEELARRKKIADELARQKKEADSHRHPPN